MILLFLARCLHWRSERERQSSCFCTRDSEDDDTLENLHDLAVAPTETSAGDAEQTALERYESDELYVIIALVSACTCISAAVLTLVFFS